MNSLAGKPLFRRQCSILILALFVCVGVLKASPAEDPTGVQRAVGTEEVLRSALSTSLQDQVAEICKEMSCEPPSVSVAADLSEILRAFPEDLSTLPTVRCHRLPCIAVTSDNWAHLAEIYAKSDKGIRHLALEASLSREDDAMTLASVSVKSTQDYGNPVAYPATNGKNKLSFDLCGVDLSLNTSRAYVVNVAGHRLGAVFDGDGKLTLEPTCARSHKMLVDFVPKPEKPIKVSRVFVSCPFEKGKREPRAIKRLRSRVQGLQKQANEGTEQADESMGKFLGDCVKSAYPYVDGETLEDLAPNAGYELPMLVVQTEGAGVFGFCFAGERGSEVVVMTSPSTGRPVSYWASSSRKDKWTIPNAERHDFNVAWHPEDLSVDMKCHIAVSGVERDRDIRFLLKSTCKVKRCQINGEDVPFTQGGLSVDDALVSSLLVKYSPMSLEGFVQLLPPRGSVMDGKADVSIEYGFNYGDTSAIETLGEGDWASFCDDGLSLNGFCEWFPLTPWRSEYSPDGGMTYEIEVPAGSTAVAQGYPEQPETKENTTIWRYTADFRASVPSFAIGRFEQFKDDEFEPELVVYARSGEVIGRRWLDALGLVVPWCERYCGKYPYKRLAIVEATPGDIGSLGWASMLKMNRPQFETWTWWILSHETSHQWWGNAATMLDYDDVWLHEGSAVYMNMLFNEDLNMRKPGAKSFKALAARTRRYESPPPISAGFRLGSRCGVFLFSVKGAYLYHILRMATNNDRHFFATLKRFQQEAQKVGLTEAVMKAAFEEAIGHDLSDLFRLYVHTGDLPGVQVEVTDVKTEGDRSTISLSAQITPGGYELPYPIDVFRKSGLAPHREVIFIGPDFGDYQFEVPFADISRIAGNPDAMLLVAQPEQEDVELYVDQE